MLSPASWESAAGNSRIFCGSVRMRPTEDFPKQAPLLAPVDPADNGPQVSFGEARAVLQRDGRQKQDLFLNVRSQIEQLHDLGDTGTRPPAEALQFRIILNRLLPQQPVKADGERHEPRDPGNGAAAVVASRRLRVECSNLVIPPSRSAGMEINGVCDFLFAAHARASCPVVIAAG